MKEKYRQAKLRSMRGRWQVRHIFHADKPGRSFDRRIGAMKYLAILEGIGQKGNIIVDTRRIAG